jgi:hypothetical protein
MIPLNESCDGYEFEGDGVFGVCIVYMLYMVYARARVCVCVCVCVCVRRARV